MKKKLFEQLTLSGFKELSSAVLKLRAEVWEIF